MVWILLGLGYALGIAMFFGKGLSFLAGYNRMSEEDRQKYDEKKLGRVSGGCWIALMIMATISQFYPGNWTTWAFVIGVILMIVLINTQCKNK